MKVKMKVNKLILIIICVTISSILIFPTGVLAETYTGNGDDVIEIENPDTENYFLMKAVGNNQERHFAIIGYDSNNNRVKSFVNTTSSYDGLRPIPANTKLLEIRAVGDWKINIKPLIQINTINTPGEISEKGDYVFKIKGEPLKAEISGNKSKRHFAVIVYDNNFNRIRSVVNTVENYEGTVMLPDNTTYFEVMANGNWNISF